MIELFQDTSGRFHWDSALIVVFGFVFLVVGIYRIVEFQGIGLSRLNRRIAIATHIAGCTVFSAALVLFAIDIQQSHKPWTTALFFSGILFFFPGQGLLAIKRRQKARIEQESRESR